MHCEMKNEKKKKQSYRKSDPLSSCDLFPKAMKQAAKQLLFSHPKRQRLMQPVPRPTPPRRKGPVPQDRLDD